MGWWNYWTECFEDEAGGSLTINGVGALSRDAKRQAGQQTGDKTRFTSSQSAPFFVQDYMLDTDNNKIQTFSILFHSKKNIML